MFRSFQLCNVAIQNHLGKLLCLILMVSPLLGLSKEQLIKLHDAGVDDSVLLQRLQANGIDFQPTSESLTELRLAGLSESVITAITSTKVRPSSTQLLAIALQAFQQGRYSDASDLFSHYLNEHPSDFGVRYLFIRSQVGSKQRSAAITNYKLLKQSTDDAARRYVTLLGPILFPEKEEELRRELFQDLSDLKAEEASAVIDRMYLLPNQKDLLKFYLNKSQGNLASGMMQLSALRVTTGGKGEGLKQLQTELQKDAESFNQILKRLSWYRLSPFTNGVCTPESVRLELPQHEYSLQEYIRLVSNAARLFPLNPHVLDLEFQAALLNSSYEDIESFGDKILGAKGSLR